MSKLNITVCMGSSCFARGNQENLAYIEEYIKEHGIDANIANAIDPILKAKLTLSEM